MQKLQSFSALILVIALLSCCIMPLTASAAISDTGTNVKFRVILNNYMKFASCTVYIAEFENMESDIVVNKFDVSIGRSDMWERALILSPGFYQITYIALTGSWNSMLAGKSERFEVKGENMTVYAGLQSKESPVTLPDPWLIYSEDERHVHIWDGTPGFIIETTAPSSPPTPSTSPDGPGLPGSVVTAVNEISSPHRPDVIPAPPTPAESTAEAPIASSARIGNILFYALSFGLIAVCAIVLFIKARRK